MILKRLAYTAILGGDNVYPRYTCIIIDPEAPDQHTLISQCNANNSQKSEIAMRSKVKSYPTKKAALIGMTLCDGIEETESVNVEFVFAS